MTQSVTLQISPTSPKNIVSELYVAQDVAEKLSVQSAVVVKYPDISLASSCGRQAVLNRQDVVLGFRQWQLNKNISPGTIWLQELSVMAEEELEFATARSVRCQIDICHELPNLSQLILKPIKAHQSQHVNLEDQVVNQGKLVSVEKQLFEVVMSYPFACGLVTTKTEIAVMDYTENLTVSIQGTLSGVIAQYVTQLDMCTLVQQLACSFDPDSLVFLSIDLMCYYEIMHGQWFKLSAGDKQKSVKCRAFAIPENFMLPQNVILLSWVLYERLNLYNLASQNVILKSLADHSFDIAKKVDLSQIMTCSVVELELGSLPSNVSAYRYRQLKQLAVRQYFKAFQRTITVGQMISISVDYYDLFDAKVQTLTLEATSSRRLHFLFKVASINDKISCSDQVIVDPDDTCLVLSKNCGQQQLPYGYFQSKSIVSSLYQNAEKRLLDYLGSWSLIEDRHNFPLSILVSGEPDCGAYELIEAVSLSGCFHLLTVSCHELAGYSSADIVTYLKERFSCIQQLGPCVLLLKDIDSISVKPFGLTDETQQANLIAKEERMIEQAISRCFKEAADDAAQQGFSVALVATTCKPVEDTPKELLALFGTNIKLQPLSDEAKGLLLSYVINCNSSDVSWIELANEAVALDYRGLLKFKDYLNLRSWDTKSLQLSQDSSFGQFYGGCQLLTRFLDHCELAYHLELYQKQYNSKSKFSLSNIPDVTFADVGGLENAKQEIYNTLIQPLSVNEKSNRTGLLFYGPPGCGKSMLAKAIANELQCTFLSVKGPELMNMYVGETEKNVRDIFLRAQQCKRAIIFFDELDSMAPRRENEGVMSRVVSQLLAELDDIHLAGNSDSMVFVIGATNRPDLLDPSLLRPGRFDRLVYLEAPQTQQEQLQILKAATRKLTLHSSVDIDDLCDMIPLSQWTGADYNAICVEALMRAVGRNIAQLDETIAQHASGQSKGKGKIIESVTLSVMPDYYLKHISSEPEKFTQVKVTQADFIYAIDKANPSVSLKELEHYRKMQTQFRNQKKIL